MQETRHEWNTQHTIIQITASQMDVTEGFL